MPASPRRPVRCAIYTRQSVGSSNALSSREVQCEACSLYLQSQRVHGWTLLSELFDDNGYSGATLDRPALNRLLTLVRRGQIDRILMHRLNRLSRGVRECVALLDELRRLAVVLVVVTAPDLGESAQAPFAEFERRLFAARISESRARLRVRHLRFACGVPFGYDSNRRTRQLVPDEEETAVVRWRFGEAVGSRNRRSKPKKPISVVIARRRQTGPRRTVDRAVDRGHATQFGSRRDAARWRGNSARVPRSDHQLRVV